MGGPKVVCLISGGKDSLFSILHCIENGHKVAALANLHPPHHENQEALDDLDSYMYQTIGHAITPLYEKALGLPLYRREITGSAKNQDKCYSAAGAGTDDETEDLIPLLRKVKAHHPEVSAVSTGAILSDYQRTRVESVAIRLGLTPLSYLWQYPNLPPFSQTSLLEHMAAVGQDARLVKVASGGLDDSFLWQNVADSLTISRLNKAVTRFGSGDDGAVLGEGGEYETLAVAGPPPLWKARVEVHEDQREVVNGEAGSAFVRILKAEIDFDGVDPVGVRKVLVPPVLEPRFQSMLDGLVSTAHSMHIARPGLGDPEIAKLIIQKNAPYFQVDDSGSILLSNLTGEGFEAADQTRSIMEQAVETLGSSGHSIADVVYSSIILRDMADFAAVNAVYSTYFVLPNPPARVTVACASVLGEGKQLTVSLTSTKLPDDTMRKGLHVQSRSYWAPANIGPYSQAISVPPQDDSAAEVSDLVYIAGQIPLLPASMKLATFATRDQSQDFLYQAVLALQHFIRIGRVMRVVQWASAIAFITAPSLEIAKQRSNAARQVWETSHASEALGSAASEVDTDGSDIDSFDVWHAKYGSANGTRAQRIEDAPLHHASHPSQVPPLRVIRVDSLPRGASIEWATYGQTTNTRISRKIPHAEHMLQIFKNDFV